MKRTVLWSDTYETINEKTKARLAEDEYNGIEPNEVYAEERAYEENSLELVALREQMKTANCGRIICYGRIGRWNGPAFGYHIFSSLPEVFFTELDTIEWFVDKKGDLRAEGSHHDGSNSYLYREITCTEDELDDLEAEIYYSGDDTEKVMAALEKYTKPLGHFFEMATAA